MSHRDLLVIGRDGRVTTNRAYYGRSTFERAPEEAAEEKDDHKDEDDAESP